MRRTTFANASWRLRLLESRRYRRTLSGKGLNWNWETVRWSTNSSTSKSGCSYQPAPELQARQCMIPRQAVMLGGPQRMNALAYITTGQG